MGTMARRVTVLAVALAVFVPATNAVARSEREENAGTPAPQRSRRPAITGGHDRKSAWLLASYRELQVNKISDRATRAITIEMQVGNDRVTVAVAQGAVSVARNGRSIVLDSAEAMQALQQILGGSEAIFAAKAMLSELEATSELNAHDMSLLSATAFVASLVGDIDAPQRIADRFVEKYRGIYRQVGMPTGRCWSAYTTETTAAWDELQGCMADADQKDFFRAAWERIACNGVWLGRSESAWFEYLNCLSPLGAINQ